MKLIAVFEAPYAAVCNGKVVVSSMLAIAVLNITNLGTLVLLESNERIA